MDDLEIIKEKFANKISAAVRNGDIYEFELKGLAPPPEKYKVKIYKNKAGHFVAKVSHYVHRSGLGGPHYVYIEGDSHLDILDEVFLHGLMNYDLNDEGAKWEKEPDF